MAPPVQGREPRRPLSWIPWLGQPHTSDGDAAGGWKAASISERDFWAPAREIPGARRRWWSHKERLATLGEDEEVSRAWSPLLREAQEAARLPFGPCPSLQCISAARRVPDSREREILSAPSWGVLLRSHCLLASQKWPAPLTLARWARRETGQDLVAGCERWHAGPWGSC